MRGGGRGGRREKSVIKIGIVYDEKRGGRGAVHRVRRRFEGKEKEEEKWEVKKKRGKTQEAQKVKSKTEKEESTSDLSGLSVWRAIDLLGQTTWEWMREKTGEKQAARVLGETEGAKGNRRSNHTLGRAIKEGERTRKPPQRHGMRPNLLPF